jgi:uncharacterized DUF497 family protein
MRFEWDETKNESNIAKHGLDFADASQVFSSPMREISDNRHDYGEDRWIGLVLLGSRVVVIAYAVPEENVVRVISMRRALAHEEKQYDQYLKQLLGN